MSFTENEIAMLCEKYEGFIRKTVYEYLHKRPVPGYAEDFLQVGRLAFYLYCRDKLTDEYFVFLAHKSITDALFRFRLKLAPVSIPINRYTKEIGKYTVVGLDEADEAYTFEDKSLENVMVRQYLDSLNEPEKTALLLWMEGLENREIMAATGIRHSYQVTRTIQRLLKGARSVFRCGGDFVECP